jgi:hypothetical protein
MRRAFGRYETTYVLGVSSPASHKLERVTLTLTLLYHRADWLGAQDVKAEFTLLTNSVHSPL